MNRKKSREVAMKLVFEMSINKENSDYIIGMFKENNEENLKTFDMEYIEKAVKGVYDNIEFIDKKIEDHLKSWKIDRISKIDLAILRLCTYEIFFENDIPNSVSINEGIELAKVYSQDSKGAFINGVLGSIEREIDSKE